MTVPRGRCTESVYAVAYVGVTYTMDQVSICRTCKGGEWGCAYRIVQLVHDIKVGYGFIIDRVDDGEVLDEWRYLEEVFVLRRSVTLCSTPTNSEAT
jgi:hypothetical protein